MVLFRKLKIENKAKKAEVLLIQFGLTERLGGVLDREY